MVEIRARDREGREAGSATVEFAGLLPALILAVLISAQLMLAGFTLWSAAVAARAGARAAEVGTDAALAARRALPGPLREGAVLQAHSRTVSARVPVPRLLPVLPVVRVEASSSLRGPGG